MPALAAGAHTAKVERLSGARVHRFSLTPTCRPIVTIRADTFWRTYAARWRHLALRFPHRSRPDGAERWSARTGHVGPLRPAPGDRRWHPGDGGQHRDSSAADRARRHDRIQ